MCLKGASTKWTKLAWIFSFSIFNCMKTLFWNDFYLFLKSFREIEVRYITILSCFVSQQRAPRGIFLVTILLNAEFSLRSMQCKDFLELIINCGVLYIWSIYSIYIIYFYLCILFVHHSCSMWLKAAKLIWKFNKWSLLPQIWNMYLVNQDWFGT